MEPRSGRLSLPGWMLEQDASLLALNPTPASVPLLLASLVSLALGWVREAAGERAMREELELRGLRLVGMVEEGRW